MTDKPKTPKETEIRNNQVYICPKCGMPRIIPQPPYYTDSHNCPKTGYKK